MNSQAPQSQPTAIASSRKGTFTDDLHKLVDNWARDAMNLSGKKVGKGHSNYEVRFNPRFNVYKNKLSTVTAVSLVCQTEYGCHVAWTTVPQKCWVYLFCAAFYYML